MQIAGVLHNIGRPLVPDFSNPLGLMSHCHRKIEGYLAGLAAAGKSLREGCGEGLVGVFQLIDAAGEYFAVRGPKHTEDEEVSLFPRMRLYGGREAERALAALEALETEHRAAERSHAEFDELVRGLHRDRRPGGKEINRFNELVQILNGLYRPHMRIEDEIVFPAAARVLPPDLLSLIGEEIRDRRRELLAAIGTAVVVPVSDRG